MPKHLPHQSKPSVVVQLIPPTWPLQRWGMDLVGPLPPSQGGNKFVVVAIEYFTRWIEVKPLTTITLELVKKFFLAEHNLQIQSTKNPNNWQWETVQLRQIQRILQEHRHKNSLRISLSSRVQWSSRKSKQNSLFSNIKDTAGPTQRKMDRWTT